MPPVNKDAFIHNVMAAEMLRAIIEAVYAQMVLRTSPVVSIAYSIGCEDVVFEVDGLDGTTRKFRAEVVVTEVLCTTD